MLFCCVLCWNQLCSELGELGQEEVWEGEQS